jgi:hypothetical protein
MAAIPVNPSRMNDAYGDMPVERHRDVSTYILPFVWREVKACGLWSPI